MLVGQYERVSNIKRDVNVRRYNKLVYQRKIRLACSAGFVTSPRLVKNHKISDNRFTELLAKFGGIAQ